MLLLIEFSLHLQVDWSARWRDSYGTSGQSEKRKWLVQPRPAKGEWAS
ncbi:hypothetical protein QUF49_06545 [Fictibacillus sp. b24]|nr:hypothetical protein [Fictibacillus sp. b24]MDM5315651.1 hypothetical protein [Fictibacillus sp. b24]